MKTNVSIQFDTGNAAFTDGAGPDEAANIITHIAGMIREGYTSGPLHDFNGNAIGSWSASFPEE